MARLIIEEKRLTTAEILYHLPDFPSLLQTYIWQDLDLTPDFPHLKKFLHFWERSIEGKLHSVRVADAAILTPEQFRFFDHEVRIH